MADKTLRSRGHRALLDVLVSFRTGAGLTTRELSARLDQYQSYVTKVESGERRIDPVECALWAEACGKEPIELFSRFLAKR
jgi:transcriptional regulator with XRE-family HTH domain